MEKIRWGIIGCGDVTEIKSGPGFQLADHSELVAVMRRNGDLAKDYAQRHKVSKWYDDAAALINDPDVDAVAVVTPVSMHFNLARAALENGKHVFVEKPFTTNVAQAEQLVEPQQVQEHWGMRGFVHLPKCVTLNIRRVDFVHPKR